MSDTDPRQARNARRRKLMVAATVLVMVVLAMHPELRLLVPLVDLLGIDVLVLLVGVQVWDLARPTTLLFRERVAIPALRRVYRLCIFMLGCTGTYVDAHLTMRFGLGNACRLR